MTYRDIAANLRANPRDISTAPVQPGRKPRWFYAYEEGGIIYVKSGQDQSPKSSIKGRRSLSEKDFSAMLNLYHRRKRGVPVSAEAEAITYQQVYWLSLIHI